MEERDLARKGSLDLYSTAAQVIPLFLALIVFELRAFAVDESVRGGRARVKLATVGRVIDSVAWSRRVRVDSRAKSRRRKPRCAHGGC
jgi:hypothetical protein